MPHLDRRHLLGGIATLAIEAGLPNRSFADQTSSISKSTLSGSGQASIERFLTMQEGVLQENASAAHIAQLRIAPRVPVSTTDRLLMWNEISLDANARDYVKPSDGSSYHIQFGPHRSSRAIAIVQLAVFEAVNSKLQRFKSYTNFPVSKVDVSIDAAIAQAAHDSLVALYPPQASIINSILDSDMIRIVGTASEISAGKTLGSQAAISVLSNRANDNSDLPEPSIPANYQPSHKIGIWDVDPISNITVALGANWGKVTPFVLSAADQFRPPIPPPVGTGPYNAAFERTKMLGGDPCRGTQTTRTESQTFIAKFWSYDGTPGLCAPPRLFNQIARQLALTANITDLAELTKFLALINIAMADAAISAWEAKYYYKYWRPVTGIRWPGALNGDPNWYPLGAQATNTVGPNITPPFPAYPSGHATFGGALFTVIRHYLKDNTPFSFVSDEFNGLNKDAYGYTRPKKTAHFKSLSDAEHSCAESRIYDGVHWQFDGDMGIIQGRKVGSQVLASFAPAI